MGVEQRTFGIEHRPFVEHRGGRHAGNAGAGDAETAFAGANQAGEDNSNVARMAVLFAGLRDTVPGGTINRLCGSGLNAVGSAGRAIRSGDAIALGHPLGMSGARSPRRR